jgi:Xaa-Pro aminopeptidase
MKKLPQSEYAKRRKQLLASLGDNAVALLPSAPAQTRNNDVEFPFRQDSDFYYLTGFAEEGAVLALIPGREEGESVLFCQAKNPEMELWTGYLAGPQGAIDQYGLSDAYTIDEIDGILPSLLDSKKRIYSSMGTYPDFDHQVMLWVKSLRAQVRLGAQAPSEFVTLEPLIHEMRMIKSPAEIDMMREASSISAAAHIRAMQQCQPGQHEYVLEAELLHEFTRNGSRWPAYSSIVGSGDNGCILHYRENDAPMFEGDLVLIDAGCELDYYAADITRTFPVGGKYSPEQAILYQIVLDAQLAAIEEVKPGNHWDHPHQAAVKVIVEGLVKNGLLAGDIDTLIEEEAYKDFYMHRTGHWIGMDVHDVGEYKINGEWRVLSEGMVLTVEPGIYVATDNTNVEARWRGIGIRIEDDVAVTKDGHEVMSHGVPKTISDIESLMAGD